MIQTGEEIDRRDPWSVAAVQTPDILAAPTDPQGRKLQLVVLPEPEEPRIKTDDFVSSYVNYYVCNGAVIAAEFDDEDADEEAEEIRHTLYPGREVVMLKIDLVGEVGGGIHSLKSQPARTVAIARHKSCHALAFSGSARSR